MLELRNISKSFGSIHALHDICMKLYDKEIIAIVGDNGAGKSTLIKTLSGLYQKDSGEIYVFGEKVYITSPLDAKKYGIETVYQDEGLIPVFDASLNLFLGRMSYQKNLLGKLFGFLDYRFMEKETFLLLKRLGLEVQDLKENVSHLSGGQRQAIKVGRAIYWGGRILIFDEPTNNLGVKQERKILELIRRTRDEFGRAVIIISHNISHVFELVDRIIVLRNGVIVGERIRAESSPNEIIGMITGA